MDTNRLIPRHRRYNMKTRPMTRKEFKAIITHVRERMERQAGWMYHSGICINIGITYRSLHNKSYDVDLDEEMKDLLENTITQYSDNIGSYWLDRDNPQNLEIRKIIIDLFEVLVLEEKSYRTLRLLK